MRANMQPEAVVDYVGLVRQAWTMTWRHRFLWLLGLFAGGTFGTPLGGGPAAGPTPDDSRGPAPPTPGVDLTADEVTRWVVSHLGLIAGAAAVLVFLGLLLLIASLMAQGGIARATADLGSGRPISAGAAWGAGRRLFWRYVGLWLLMGVAAAVVVVAVIVLVALAAGLAALAGQNAAWVLVPAVLVALPLVLLGIAAAVALSIVVPYAQRAIAVRDIGPLAALGDGWSILRACPGPSLLVWLINLALGIAGGIAVAVAMIPLVLVLGVIGVAVWGAAGLTASTIAYGVVAMLAVLAMLLMLLGILNTFLWSYWTLAYLRLSSNVPDKGPEARAASFAG